MDHRTSKSLYSRSIFWASVVQDRMCGIASQLSSSADLDRALPCCHRSTVQFVVFISGVSRITRINSNGGASSTELEVDDSRQPVRDHFSISLLIDSSEHLTELLPHLASGDLDNRDLVPAFGCGLHALEMVNVVFASTNEAAFIQQGRRYLISGQEYRGKAKARSLSS